MTVSPAPVTSAISSLPKIGTNVDVAALLEERQPLRAARDEEAPGAEALEKLPAGLLHGLVPVERRSQEMLDLRLARRRGREVVEPQEVVSRVGRHDDPALLHRPDLGEDARRDRAIAVVRQDHRVDLPAWAWSRSTSSVSMPGGIAPSGSRSTRTICWRAERDPHPPPRIRVLTGVGRRRHRDDAVSGNAALEQRARRIASPAASAPTTPSGTTFAPRVWRLWQAFAAPPRRVSWERYRRISTGASRETRSGWPNTYSSATRSPTTRTRRPSNPWITRRRSATSELPTGRSGVRRDGSARGDAHLRPVTHRRHYTDASPAGSASLASTPA